MVYNRSTNVVDIYGYIHLLISIPKYIELNSESGSRWVLG